MTDQYLNYWRAKRLCGLSARAFRNATRRLRDGQPAGHTLARARRLQQLGLREMKRCAI